MSERMSAKLRKRIEEKISYVHRPDVEEVRALLAHVVAIEEELDHCCDLLHEAGFGRIADQDRAERAERNLKVAVEALERIVEVEDRAAQCRRDLVSEFWRATGIARQVLQQIKKGARGD